MSTPVFLAVDGSPSLFLIIAGLAVVLLLLGAFWYGSRRSTRGKTPGALRSDQNPQAAARRNSWQTSAEETDTRS
ncbi:DUF6479 family protein [Streptomyces sp. NPDC001935]